MGQVGPKFRYFANIESLERKHADDDGFGGVKVLKFLFNSLYMYIYIYIPTSNLARTLMSQKEDLQELTDSG